MPEGKPGFISRITFVSCFVGVIFVQHLMAWKRGCWQSKHKNASLTSFAEEEGRFAEPLQEEEMNRVCEGFTPDNTTTEQFTFQVS